MRFLQLKLEVLKISGFKEFYEKEVIPELHNAPGCLFAGLIKLKPADNEYISLTFWDTKENAENYETKGAFLKLFEEAKQYLAETAEWKLQLSENMELTYDEVEEKPDIKRYVVAVQNRGNKEFKFTSKDMFIRIMSMIIQKNKLEEFKNLYTDHIIPELENTKGCLYVFLTESVNKENEFISVTIWNSKEDADEYEASGKFEELAKKIRHTFSQLYLWKMSLEKEYGPRMKTSDDFKLERYDIVTGQSFL